MRRETEELHRNRENANGVKDRDGVWECEIVKGGGGSISVKESVKN